MYRTTQVIKEGINECNHKWIYSDTGIVLTSNPPIYKTERVCEICGRLEEVTEQNENSNRFQEVCSKFNNDVNTVRCDFENIKPHGISETIYFDSSASVGSYEINSKLSSIREL